jgi:hypothetical protein
VGEEAAIINFSFLQPDGITKAVQAKVGETLLQSAQRYDIELEGACEGKHVMLYGCTHIIYICFRIF